jgi:surfactin synthase thioesterase subunit
MAHMKLFCLPFAGGGASAYRAWRAHLPAQIELCPIQLPGRESRYREPLVTSIAPLVASLADAIVADATAPYAFFGHSMGALLAFEIARELRRRAATSPLHLFVSGAKAPDDRSLHTIARHRLSDPDLIAEVRNFGGTPARLLDDPDVMQLILPVVRADFALLESYTHTHERPLSMPITAFAGVDDREAAPDAMRGWSRHTHDACRVMTMPGQHFFLQEPGTRAAMVAAISRALLDVHDDVEQPHRIH